SGPNQFAAPCAVHPSFPENRGSEKCLALVMPLDTRRPFGRVRASVAFPIGTASVWTLCDTLGRRRESEAHTMSFRYFLPATLFVLANASPVLAQDAAAPGDKEPLLRLEAGGPTSYVTSLAFGLGGTTLYAAGWDKVVRVWTLDAQGRFVLD